MLRKVTVKQGVLRGIPAADPKVTAFKGVPFAKAPVGALRWRAPQPAEAWEGVRDAIEFAPISMQVRPGGGDPEDLYNKEFHVDPDVPMSEDCLYLNVWTPAKRTDEKLPVMVWFFGGAFQVGYTSEREFDGERLARRGVVMVSVNYRVNVFGFFAHPELSETQPEAPTNFGHLDQLAGLEWVRENIEAFGGDPENVTIFGQSAGAMSVLTQLISPQARGTFHKAILQSGGGVLPRPVILQQTLAEAEAKGQGFLDSLGLDLEAARQMPAQELMDKALAYSMEKLGGFMGWTPSIDGVFYPQSPYDTVMGNGLAEVPIMIGATANEFRSPRLESLDALREWADAAYGERADALLEACGVGEYSEDEVLDRARVNGFALGNWTWAELNARTQNLPMYIYHFDPPIPGDDAGSFHSSDLWFSFETLAKCWRPFKGPHYDLARIMCNYWTNFAKYGDPNGKDADGSEMPRWTTYDSKAPSAMRLDMECRMEPRDPVMSFMVEEQLGESKHV